MYKVYIVIFVCLSLSLSLALSLLSIDLSTFFLPPLYKSRSFYLSFFLSLCLLAYLFFLTIWDIKGLIHSNNWCFDELVVDSLLPADFCHACSGFEAVHPGVAYDTELSVVQKGELLEVVVTLRR